MVEQYKRELIKRSITVKEQKSIVGNQQSNPLPPKSNLVKPQRRSEISLNEKM